MSTAYQSANLGTRSEAACESRLVVECGRQRLAGFCEHGQTGSGTLGGREACSSSETSVITSRHDLRVVDVEDRVVADEQVTGLLRCGPREFHLQVEDRSPVRAPGGERFDLRGELLAEHVSKCAPEMLVAREPFIAASASFTRTYRKFVSMNARPTGAAAKTAVDDCERLLCLAP